jgi:hypothetical protein
MTPILDYPPRMPETEASQSGESPPLTNVEVRSINPLVDSGWDQAVLSHPGANFFHSSAWAKVLSKSYGHKPLYLHFCARGVSLALLPLMEVRSYFTGRRGVCLPFSDFCGPLLFNHCEPGVIAARLSALALEHNWKHFEIRDGNAFELGVKPAVEYREHILDLQQTTEALFAGFSSSVRRAIRKAEKSGLKVEVSQSSEALMDFYRLHVQTRRQHGLPPQPLFFFRNIFDEVIRAGLGFVVRASLASRWVAAAVFFQFGQTAIYKFGASEAASYEFRPNNLVIWEAIRFLAQTGCESLHLGRTSLNNAGLRRFKLGWGTAEEVIRYFKWDTTAGKWISGCDRENGVYNALFARMPLALNRLAGALLYPHLD